MSGVKPRPGNQIYAAQYRAVTHSLSSTGIEGLASPYLRELCCPSVINQCRI